MKPKTFINCVVCFFIFVSWVSCSNSDKWEGSIEIKDGYKVIKNVGKGLYDGKFRERLHIRKIIGAENSESSSHEDIFGLIKWIEFDADGNIYVLDKIDQAITKISPPGRILLKLGRKGQGPGELLGCSQFVWTNSKLYCANRNNGRIEVFNDQGESLPAIQLEDCKMPSKIFYHEGFFYVGELFLTAEGFALYKYDSNWTIVDRIKPGQQIHHQFDLLRSTNSTRPTDDGFWLVFHLDNRIQKVRWDGGIIFETSRKLDWLIQYEQDGKLIPENVILGSCDLDPHGNLYVVYSDPSDTKRIRNSVYKFGTDGRLHGKVFDLPIEKATMIRFDQRGNFYFSDGIALYIARIIVEELKS